MRKYILYQSARYNTSDASLKALCREIFKNEQGCPDGYEKVWETVYFSWGDEELGGSAEVENERLEVSEITVTFWDKGDKGEGMFEDKRQFWAWYPFYGYLFDIIWNFSHKNTKVIADFWSFPETFSKYRDIEEELKRLYVLVSACNPGLGEISSVDNGKPFEIYTGAEKFTIEIGTRETPNADKEEVVRIYLPSVSSYEEFVNSYGQELYQILSELDTD